MCTAQFIEASNLDQETAKSDPIKYHAAWQALCTSQYADKS